MQTNQLLSSNQVKQQIRSKKFPTSHDDIIIQLFNMIRYFFRISKDETELDIPFRGVLLNGSPSSGKTEMTKQLVLRLTKALKEEGIEVKFILLDSKSIAKAKWGESESMLSNMFDDYIESGNRKSASPFYTDENEKIVYLFDDIDCFFFDRNCSVSMEWNYAVSSTFFHILDNLNPYNRMIIATSNNLKVMDTAMLSRFYKIIVPDYTKAELIEIASGMVKKLKSVDILAKIKKIIIEKDNPTMRDVENLILNQYISDIASVTLPKKDGVTYAEIKINQNIETVNLATDGVIRLETLPNSYRMVEKDRMSPISVCPIDAKYNELTFHLHEGMYQIRTWNIKKGLVDTYQIKVYPSFRIEYINN